MARLTETYGFGRVAADFTPEALARTLNALTPAEIDSLKRNALSARTQLNAQVEMSKLQALYGHLLAGSA
jgi:phage terminase Nu1 subunit (DNA packaging protein)